MNQTRSWSCSNFSSTLSLWIEKTHCGFFFYNLILLRKVFTFFDIVGYAFNKRWWIWRCFLIFSLIIALISFVLSTDLELLMSFLKWINIWQDRVISTVRMTSKRIHIIVRVVVDNFSSRKIKNGLVTKKIKIPNRPNGIIVPRQILPLILNISFE